MIRRTPESPRSTRWRRNARPARLVLLGALADPQDLPVALGIHRARHQQRDIAHLARPGPLHHDAVQVQIRVIALDRPVPPRLDLGVDLLVEIGHRAGTDPRAPQGLGDVLDPPNRNPGQVHLNQGLLDRALPSPIALDDRRLECLTAKLRNFQRHLAGLGVQRPFITAGPRVRATLRPLVARRAAQPIRLRVQHRVQRFLDRPPDHLPKMVPDPTLVDPDHLPHALALLFVRHPDRSSSQCRRSRQIRKCERFFTLSVIH